MVHFGAGHHGTVWNGAVLPKSRKRVFEGRLDPNHLPQKMREKGIIMPWEAGTHCR